MREELEELKREPEEEDTAQRRPRRTFVTLPEVAEAKGISRVAVLYAIRSGKLPATRIEGRREWMIHVEDARKYLSLPVRSRAAV